jgi:hypothetical protein
VSVLEDQRLLDVVIVALQLVEVGFERSDLSFESQQSAQVIFQFTLLHAGRGDGVQMALNPLTDYVGFLCEGAAQSLVVLLPHELVTQGVVAIWNKRLDLVPLVGQVLHMVDYIALIDVLYVCIALKDRWRERSVARKSTTCE